MNHKTQRISVGEQFVTGKKTSQVLFSLTNDNSSRDKKMKKNHLTRCLLLMNCILQYLQIHGIILFMLPIFLENAQEKMFIL